VRYESSTIMNHGHDEFWAGFLGARASDFGSAGVSVLHPCRLSVPDEAGESSAETMFSSLDSPRY